MKKTQSIPNGTKCIFDVKDLRFELAEVLELSDEELEMLNGQECTVTCLQTYTELGDQNYEYYDIVFADGRELAAMSGYHLKLVG